MARFESERVLINASTHIVSDFVGDFRNFESLMPKQITNWRADEVSCAFTIPGMADMAMRIQSRIPGRSVHIVSDGQTPINFHLDVFMQPRGDRDCLAEIVVEADLNPFLSMMASKPLQNLVDLMARHLKLHFEASH